eukprot:876543-Pelagomonas_calceolata.AAC.1
MRILPPRIHSAIQKWAPVTQEKSGLTPRTQLQLADPGALEPRVLPETHQTHIRFLLPSGEGDSRHFEMMCHLFLIGVGSVPTAFMVFPFFLPG